MSFKNIFSHRCIHKKNKIGYEPRAKTEVSEFHIELCTMFVDSYGEEITAYPNENSDFNKQVQSQEDWFVDGCDIIELIGSGGVSEVYKAYHTRLNKTVAIKRFNPKSNIDADISRHERDILLGLKHPYIPTVYDYVENHSGKYLVMEYISDSNLNIICKNGNLHINRILKYASQLFEVLIYLNNLETPIIHSDIKPANIMMSDNDSISLIDFGISYKQCGRKVHAQTPGYAAPERYNWGRDYDPHLSEIYSIGATIFYMSTGISPPPDAKRIDLFVDKYKEKIQNDILFYVIKRAMEFEPCKRFQSISEMRNILMKNELYDYDIALSFAGEDRSYVEKVAECLIKRNIRVFYDMHEQANLWGKDLFTYLDDVYQNRSKYCIMFISKYYKSKLWTSHEMKSAFARAFQSKREYILPARFDNTVIPGLRLTTGYIDLHNKTPKQFADLAIDKVLGDYL